MYDELNDIYIVYSVDKNYKGKAIYPDDPRVIEALVIGWMEAEKVVYYLRGKDSSRLYGYECWTVFKTANEFVTVMDEIEGE